MKFAHVLISLKAVRFRGADDVNRKIPPRREMVDRNLEP
jgi:hypothetical protein